MKVDVICRRLEQAMFVEVGFANAQLIAGRLQLRRVRPFVSRISDDQQDVHDRLGGKFRHRRRADVFDAQRALAQRAFDGLEVSTEAFRPAGVVVDDSDGGRHDANQSSRARSTADNSATSGGFFEKSL